MKRTDIVTLFEKVHSNAYVDIHDYMMVYEKTAQLVVQTGMCTRHYLYRDMLSILVVVDLNGRTAVCEELYEEYPKETYTVTEDKVTVTARQGTVVRLTIRCKE